VHLVQRAVRALFIDLSVVCDVPLHSVHMALKQGF
jgi:hypothetical protein